jgi:hypothetical protein
VAWLSVALVVPSQSKRASPAKDRKGLYDFQPVFRNRLAMAYLRLPRIRGGDYGASAVAVSRRLSWPPGLAS